jgi:diguanylate cyclase (GGDEF)-like protein
MSVHLSTRVPFVVLMVEDDLVDNQLLSELLQEADAPVHELVHVRSLAEAIAAVTEIEIDLVLLRLRLPDSDGLETFVRLQAVAPGIPIVPHNGLTRSRLEERQLRLPMIADDRRMGLCRGNDVVRCLQRAVRRRLLEQSLFHLATHDQLTGVANRVLLEDRVRQAVARSRRSGLPGALVFLDLDEFKQINDIHGHERGDRVLVTLAGRLARALRETDTVARFGGDEFILLIEGLADREAIGALIDKIAQVLARPVRIDGLLLRVSASIGVALFPVQGQDMATLIREADGAMYDAKRAGHGLCRFASPEPIRARAS